MGYDRQLRGGYQCCGSGFSRRGTRGDRIAGPSRGGRWDWAPVRQLAARLSIPPAALWRYTLRDLMEQAEGYRWRERQAWERLAWQTSILLHAWVKDAPSPQQLLGQTVTDPEAAMAKIVGELDSLAALDRAYQLQAERRTDGSR